MQGELVSFTRDESILNHFGNFPGECATIHTEVIG